MLFISFISLFLTLIGVLELKRLLSRNKRKRQANSIMDGYKQALKQNNKQEIEIYEQSFRKTRRK